MYNQSFRMYHRSFCVLFFFLLPRSRYFLSTSRDDEAKAGCLCLRRFCAWLTWLTWSASCSPPSHIPVSVWTDELEMSDWPCLPRNSPAGPASGLGSRVRVCVVWELVAGALRHATPRHFSTLFSAFSPENQEIRTRVKPRE